MKYTQLPLIVWCLFISGLVSANDKFDPTPSLGAGAWTFQARCTMCHGNNGMGDGLLSLTVKDYPDTNLHAAKYGKTSEEIREAIYYGGSKHTMNELMPPWGDELTATELDSVVMFILYMREDPEEASEKLKQINTISTEVSMKLGRTVYKGRCSLCHGPDGEGNGKMARIIKDPPPFNLTKSGVPYSYLKEIVTKGGEAMGRSGRMPPWGKELSRVELDSILLYVMSLRGYNPKK